LEEELEDMKTGHIRTWGRSLKTYRQDRSRLGGGA